MAEISLTISNGTASVSGGGSITDPTILLQAKSIMRKLQDLAETPASTTDTTK